MHPTQAHRAQAVLDERPGHPDALALLGAGRHAPGHLLSWQCAGRAIVHSVTCTALFLSPSSRPCSPGQVLLSIGWCGPFVLTLAVMLCWAPC